MKRILLLSCLCFNLGLVAQTNTDILLFDLTINSQGITLSNRVNITAHKGYDNQPCFYKTSIYYSSQIDSGQMDIKQYDIFTKQTTSITNTDDNEFSPTITPDGQFISCILQRKSGKQDLVKYPLGGGAPILIIDNLKVGYHTWADKNNLLLFVLEADGTNKLHYVNIVNRTDQIIATDTIGRALQKIPGRQALSFVDKTPAGSIIRQLVSTSKQVTTITPALPNGEFHVWTKAGLLLMSNGREFYFKNPKKQGDWQKVIMKNIGAMGKISRLAINDQNTKLAVVVSE